MQKLFRKENYKYIVLLACMFPYCMSTLVRWNYTSISGYLATDLGIGKPELGLLASVFFYGYTLSQVPSGLAVDKFGGRWVMPVGVALMGIFSVGFALSQSFEQAMVWRFLLGLVGATVYVPAVAILAKWFPRHQRGLANNIFNGFGGGLGEVIMFMLVPLMALISGAGLFGISTWRLSTIIVAITIILIAIGAAVFLRSDRSDMGLPSISKQEETKEESSSDEDYKSFCKRVFFSPALWGLGATWCGYIIATRLVLGWIATYAAAYYMTVEHMSKGEAMVAGGGIASMYVVGRYIGAPLSGFMSDYLLKKYMIPRTAVLFVGLVIAAGLFAALAFIPPTKFILGALVFFCGLIFNFYSLVNACAAELWSSRGAGFSMGVINTIAQLLGAMTLSASGFLAVKFAVNGGAFHTEYSGIWYFGIIVMVIAALSTIYMIKVERNVWYKRSLEKVK